MLYHTLKEKIVTETKDGQKDFSEWNLTKPKNGTSSADNVFGF
jgi:hypothetical protein